MLEVHLTRTNSAFKGGNLTIHMRMLFADGGYFD